MLNVTQESFLQLDPNKVVELIERQGLKKWWVAEAAGVHKTTLRRWLSGKIVKVRRENADRLAEALTVTTSGIANRLTLGVS